MVGTEEGIRSNNDLNDKASGIYNVAYASGTILAPNIGGILTDTYDFQTMCDVLACFSLCFSIIFLFANVGVKTFCDIKPDPRLDEPEEPRKKKLPVIEGTDPKDLISEDDSGLLDKGKVHNINKSELSRNNMDNYASASQTYPRQD